MYGALTGLSKKMIAQRHGESQFMAWRRGYRTRPPPASSFSPNYPGNDDRYLNGASDHRISVRQSVMRSVEHRRLELHRKLPKTESLRDCMKRTIPYFSDVIKPDAIDQGRNVLIASSENAIRGLLMHLCAIPPDRIAELEIPTGVPLVYDLDTRRAMLLDDGLSPPPRERYDFGACAELLFRGPASGGGADDDATIRLADAGGARARDDDADALARYGLDDASGDKSEGLTTKTSRRVAAAAAAAADARSLDSA